MFRRLGPSSARARIATLFIQFRRACLPLARESRNLPSQRTFFAAFLGDVGDVGSPNLTPERESPGGKTSLKCWSTFFAVLGQDGGRITACSRCLRKRPLPSSPYPLASARWPRPAGLCPLASARWLCPLASARGPLPAGLGPRAPGPRSLPSVSL